MNNIHFLSSFIISLGDKNAKLLLQMLRTEINETIAYFSSNIALNIKNKEELEVICKEIIVKGYDYFFKIKAILEVLHITDQSQTHKYKYEECFSFVININSFIDSIHTLFINKYDLDIQKIISIGKINSEITNLSTELSDKYTCLIESKKELIFYEEINILNSYINQCIFSIFKINQIIKNIEIY